jgi:di/tricarboxylate transporter
MNVEQDAAAVAAPPSFFKKYKREIGLLLGIAVCLAVWLMPQQAGLPVEGQQCLGLSLMAVLWWGFGVMHPGFTALVLLLGWVLTKTAEPAVIFRLWITPLIYIVVGGYLIAAAVEKSGLGKRLAYWFILKYVHSFNSIIGAGYIIGFLLSFMIPHPWPRSFMIMSVMAILVKATNLPARDAANVGLSVFAGSVPVSAILLTGDSLINSIAMGFGGVEASWLKWLLYMGVPALLCSVLTYLLQITLFRPPAGFKVHKDEIREQLKSLGALTRNEKVTVFWVLLAVAFWSTDSLHHIHPGWVALAATCGLALPRVGDVLEPRDWAKVSVATLFFMTAALGIGSVGATSGMNKWLATVLLPSHVPSNVFLLALMVTAFTVVIHLCLGSVLAVMGIVTPTVVAFTAGTGLDPLVPALLVYTAVGMHFFLPFHHMSVLVGEGESGGHYGTAEVARLGIPMTVIIFLTTVCIEIPWWKLIGLIH